MKKIMQFLFLSCLKATELIEKNLHFKLSFKEKLQMKVHKMMCDACTHYEKQTVFLEKGIAANLENIQEIKMDKGVEELKKTILEKLPK